MTTRHLVSRRGRGCKSLCRTNPTCRNLLITGAILILIALTEVQAFPLSRSIRSRTPFSRNANPRRIPILESTGPDHPEKSHGEANAIQQHPYTSPLFRRQQTRVPVIRKPLGNSQLVLAAAAVFSVLSGLTAFPQPSLAGTTSAAARYVPSFATNFVQSILVIVTKCMFYLSCHRKQILYATFSFLIVYNTIDLIRVKQRQRLDATSEWGRYASRPGARGRAILSLCVIKMVPLFTAAKLLGWLGAAAWKESILQYSGGIFADGLLQLGPLYIKLGQIVSCRKNLLPAAWTRSMERLQDRVPSRSGQQALDLAYAAWPRGQDDFHRTFSQFETTPLAAASLGQVHKGVLASNGDVVAIKLQRPYLREIYDQDLALLTKVAAMVDKFGGERGQVGGVSQSWTKIFEDAEAILYREIDYRDEAENAIRFCNDFGLTRGGQPGPTEAVSKDGKPLPSAAPWLRTPFVYGNLSSEKVLVMEFVPSIKITNSAKLDDANVTEEERIYLADMLGRSYLRQFCCNCFFSTDPHPGNLGVEILSSSGNGRSPQERVRLVFYDFGQASKLNQNQADGILSIIEAIVDMDVDRSIESFQQMGVLQDGADLNKVRAKVADNFKSGKVKANRKRLTKSGYKFKEQRNSTSSSKGTNSSGNVSTTDAEIMSYFTLPAEYAFVGRALSQMDGVGKSLDPEFDFVSAAAPWIYEIKGAGKYVREEVMKWFKSVCDKVESVFQV